MANGTTIESTIADEPDLLPQDELPPDTDPNGDAAIEARAREMGWKPLSEYRGPPGRWQNARDFIQRGEEIVPIVRDLNRRLGEKVAKLEGEVTGLRTATQEQLQIIKDLRDMGARADQRGYDRAMAEIKSKQRLAVAAGDTESYDQLVEQQEALQLARTEVTAAPVRTTDPARPVPPQTPQLSEATRTFIQANPWFSTDQFLTRKIIDRHLDVVHEGEIVDEAQQYAEAKRRLMEDYPDRFGMPVTPRPQPRPARRGAPVQAPTPPAPPDPGAQRLTIASIADPAERSEARSAFDRAKRHIPGYTEAEYMRLYNDPHADVLELQREGKKRSAGARQ